MSDNGSSFVSCRLSPALMAYVALSAVALAACGHSSSQTDTSSPAPWRRESVAATDACSLLEPKEIEAVLGAPLATPPFLSRDGVPKRDGSVCEYEDANLHSITIDVNFDGGAMAFKMLGALQGLVDQTAAKGLVHLADGTDRAGEWDEAHAMGCCTFAALRGDQMVTIDVGGSKAGIVAAATLADAALKRLDHALPISGMINVKPAVEFETAHRPKRRDPCALVSRAEAEALIGTLAGEPESADDRCVYDHAVGGRFVGTYVLKVRWKGGFSEFGTHNQTFAAFSKDLTRNAPLTADGKEAITSSAAGTDLPANPAWETAHWDISGLSAVKRDVLISIEPQGGDADHAVKLMEKAMSRL